MSGLISHLYRLKDKNAEAFLIILNRICICQKNAGLKGEILGALKNGTEVETTGDVCRKDGYDWYMVHLVTGSDDAWIAGSLIGY